MTAAMNSVQTGGDILKDDDDDVAPPAADDRNWKGIFIAILVIAVVLGMIVTSVILVTPEDDGPRVKGFRIEIDDILGDNFTIKEFNGTWISDSEFAFLDQDGGMSLYNAQTQSKHVLINNNTLQTLNMSTFNLSADMRFVMLSRTSNTFAGQFHSTAKYFVYNVEHMQLIELTPTPDLRGHPELVYAKWAPTGSGLIMVDTKYNILYKKMADAKEVYRITDTGVPGLIYNGAPDYIYHAEILKDKYATWFSTDGQMLAYATFNDSLVEEVPIIHFGQEKEYSRINTIRYPRAGELNPKVTLWVADLHIPMTISKRDVVPPNPVKDHLMPSKVWDHYFTAVTWIDAKTLSVVWMNRGQNVSVVTICNPPVYFCDAAHTDTSHHGWVDLYEAPIFSADGQSFLVRLPVPNGDGKEFRHVNLFKRRLQMVNVVTHGSYEVTEILGWDQENNYIYFMGTAVEQPGTRHLYRVSDLLSSAILRYPECLSCFDSDNVTESCLYSRAHLSKEFTYFVLDCLGPNAPRTYLFSTEDLQDYTILNNHDSLRHTMAAAALPTLQTFLVEVEGSPYKAVVQLFLPASWRKEEGLMYPMVVHVDGSPGSQSVTSRLRFSYGTYLASKKNIVYAFIDGRGTGFQGDKIKHEVFLSLGDKEVSDQLSVVRFLKDTLPFIDPKRIMIWGRKYGGYLTTMALSRDEDEIFSCGVAVSPIINWKYYNSIYTERYMGSPHVFPGSNYKGYDSADATKVAGNLRNKKFLIIHGTADQDVHFLHSMLLTKALTDAGVLFQQINYPDEGSQLRRVEKHLYSSLDKFISECFRPSVEELYQHIKKKRDLEELGYLYETDT